LVDEAALRGLDFEHRSGHLDRPLLPEIIGGGAALVDVDGDGDLDAYLVQSGWHLASGPDVDAPGNRLYLNRGDGYFVAAVDSGAEDRGYGMGVAAGDYDNDGDVDLYVTNVGANVLLRNNGQGRFTDVAEAAGVDDVGWGTSAAFLDLDADGDLDLFVVNYVNWSVTGELSCYERSEPVYCLPVNYKSPGRDRLFRNDGDGSFTDVTDAAGLYRDFGNGLGVVGADFDGDGRTDVFVANDGTVNQLWLNRGGLRFDNEAASWGCAMDDHGIAKAGMGVAAADMDNDADTDLLVVNIEGQTDSFFQNAGTYFVDATARLGLSVASRRYTRFGVALADFDNDGWFDLYQANGKVYPAPGMTGDGYAEPNLLLRGVVESRGLRFHEVAPSDETPPEQVHTSRAVAVGDVDGDGGEDLVVVNRDGPVYLLMNRAPRGNWVEFRVRTTTGRDAHGATVIADVGAERLRRAVQPAASYLASNDPRVHFGLGTESLARNVTVRWPDDSYEAFGDVAGGAVVELRRGDGRAVAAP
jgi:hypothetical protein